MKPYRSSLELEDDIPWTKISWHQDRLLIHYWFHSAPGMSKISFTNSSALFLKTAWSSDWKPTTENGNHVNEGSGQRRTSRIRDYQRPP